MLMFSLLEVLDLYERTTVQHIKTSRNVFGFLYYFYLKRVLVNLKLNYILK